MFFELLKTVVDQYTKELPFVVYRKPKETSVKAILQEDSDIRYVKDFTESGFVFAPFDSQEPSVLMQSDTNMSEDYFPQFKTTFELGNSVQVNQSRKALHINLIEKGITHIKQGEFKKVVLSRKVETECVTSPIDLFQKLLDTYRNAFCYLWYHPKIGTWLGATPEILLKTENQEFTTMSLAGTKKYVADKSPEWGNKEFEEQQLVTDYISNVLQNSVSNLNIGERESIRAGNLWHLRTKLTGRIEKGNLASIVKALHPTPAVCGLPMESAKDFILGNENYNREYYTGFLGELNIKSEKDRTSNSRNQENKAYRSIKNTTTLFVNLRCMQLKGTNAQIYVGGGVTQDSEPEKEWRETVAKSKTMLQVFAID
ncbi:isochorismate synthase [Maribacter algarum]|uniref:Isochorismate synthase n=1 Tax=Maribacter algarum (ex Zhang et al. 2020) TaxID=2578118 RepID=A0A5S3PQS4_9FLAO|nr:chorismate-binding protein [Maribacter algarum]TMM56979.1 isochorismate synthase [Maribacter algarum]